MSRSNRAPLSCQQIHHRLRSAKALCVNSSSNPKTTTTEIQSVRIESRRPLIISATTLAFIGSLSTFNANSTEQGNNNETSAASKKVFLDISVDGKASERIIIELYDDVQLGGQRFLDLAIGQDGIRYQATKFTKLSDNYVLNGGVKSLYLSNTRTPSIAGGDSIEGLLKELEERRHSHDRTGVVSLVLKNAIERPKKKKLVAVKGKLVTVEEGGSIAPNGTAFAITTQPAEELDSTNLVVGQVVSGMDTIQSLQELPRVKNNSSSVFYKTAKFIGDVRADVAELSFGKPYNRIIVMAAGDVS
eukprot:g9253.t1